jgi:hypothetical protein
VQPQVDQLGTGRDFGKPRWRSSIVDLVAELEAGA